MESANCDTEQQKKTETLCDDDINKSHHETESTVVLPSSANGSYEKNRSRSPASSSKATDFSQNVEGHINQTAAVNIAGGTSDDDESDGEIGETTNLLEKTGMSHQNKLNSIISWCETEGSCASVH